MKKNQIKRTLSFAFLFHYIYTREVLENALDSTVTRYGDPSNRVTTGMTYQGQESLRNDAHSFDSSVVHC